MKILFIYPNADSQLGFNYGIAHLSAVLKQAGHRTALWQLCEQLAPLPTREQFVARLKQEAPDVVGFSVVTNQWTYARQLAAWARQATTVPLVCGGIHTLAAGREVLQTGLFDYIIRGEAEAALAEFIEKKSRDQNVADIGNLGMVQDGTIRLNPLRPLPDLSGLPFKDYSIFDFQKIIDAKNGWVGLMASRGCPFSCTYCFNHQVVAHYRKDLNCSFKQLNYIRHFPIEQLMAEIRFLRGNYRNIQMFIFDDDLFTYYRPYVKQFCQSYRATCPLPFVVNAHVGFFEKNRARDLAEANCKIVKFGVESGSERIRKQVLQRWMSNEKIVSAIQTAHRFGLHTSVFLMIGLPGETREDILATVRLMAAAKPGRFRWSYFFPYPGTKAYDLSADGGFIDYEKMAQMDNFTAGSCLDFGAELNLFVKKVGRALPWFVNAYSDLPTAAFYQAKIKTILAMDAASWETYSDHVSEEDREISRNFVNRGLSHYAIKYNPFMGVISDYFATEP